MFKNKLTVKELCQIGVFTAIITVLAQISIPMPYGVPMTLQTFAIPLAGVVLGAKKGTITATVYVLLGALGIPVFAEFTGGLGIVFGATGGFILSFPILALLAGMGSGKNNILWLSSGLISGAVINYLCGMLMFSAVTGYGLDIAFTACVLPFIPTSIVKMVLVGVIGTKCKRILVKGGVLAS